MKFYKTSVYFFPHISRFQFFLFFYIGISCASFSATKTWANTAGGAWNTGSNWSPSGVPAADDDIIIPAFTSTATSITNIPGITINSMVFTGTGYCWLRAQGSGNTIVIRNTWTVPSTCTITIGNSGERLVWTTSVTCVATINGYVAFDAGNSNRNFTINGKLIVPSGGMIYDPNPSGGSDFYLTATGTLVTGKAQGITTVAAANAAAINYSVAISFGGQYSYAAGACYEYNGSVGQLTGVGLTQNTPGSMTVNLSSGNTLTLSAATTVSNNLVLTSGLVNLNSSSLTLGTSATNNGTLTFTEGLLHNGTFSRWFRTTAVTVGNVAGLFPMGTSNDHFRPFWVGSSVNLTTGGVVRVTHSATYPATYVPAVFVDASWGFSVGGVSNSTWAVATASSIAFNGSSANIRFGGEGFGTNTLTELGASLVGSAIGSHAAATNVATVFESNRTALTTAQLGNTWRVSTKNLTLSPLPIELLSFMATPKSDHVAIDWSTATEKNCNYYSVERSADGKSFEEITRVDGQGSSSTKHKYSVIDPSPFLETNYYRLKQVDFNGAENFHPIASVYYEGPNPLVEVQPNPTTGVVTLHLYNIDKDDVQSLQVVDLTGRTVLSVDGFVPTIDLSALLQGVYFLRCEANGNLHLRKIVKTN